MDRNPLLHAESDQAVRFGARRAVDKVRLQEHPTATSWSHRMTTPLNIGMIGYGFMGRAHTNGYKRVGDFFPELEYRPILRTA
jgi:hypothetical protein